MGDFGSFECSATSCDYASAQVDHGPGMLVERELRSCAACGGLTSVLTVRFGENGPEPASGRGRCPECGSQRLRKIDDSEDAADTLPCPRCASPLLWHSLGMWD
ncbi:unannotated protein [freshwater metagenome]|uniref:Unannotated protein n=1 Tax=freshwater metagenome TaxID=449393 RepID=A0A6J7KGI1_9ZZZZ